jgi:hypothetical protein
MIREVYLLSRIRIFSLPDPGFRVKKVYWIPGPQYWCIIMRSVQFAWNGAVYTQYGTVYRYTVYIGIQDSSTCMYAEVYF